MKRKIIERPWQESLIPNFAPQETDDTVSSWRLVFLGSLFLIVFFGLFLRLFHLQVVQGAKNRELADSNRIKLKVIHAPRGVIYDRSGKVLAENSPGFRVKEKFLSRDEALALEARNDPQFADLEIDAIRFYPQGKILAHVLGYVGQISEEELKSPHFVGYKIGDRVGRFGIEQVYESTLRGKDGAEIIEVDASGKTLRTLGKVEPVPGKDIHLSLDGDLQAVVFKSLEEGIKNSGSCCGAAVAENPKSGEVLALASYPSFDNNAFTDPKRNKEVKDYFTDINSPLINRAIAGTYPPGSTFKIASALAGLSSGKITKDTQIEDTGVMSLGIWQFANWYFTSYGKKEGMVDIIKALQRSNDIFFYKVGDLVGEKALGQAAKKIGYGQKLGIDLSGEAEGLIPDKEWKQKNIGESWYPGDNLHLAIGQGFLLVTPLQVLASTSFVAADGKLISPHLVPRGISKSFKPLSENIFKKEDIELVKRGLGLVPKVGGTAWPFFTFGVPTAGKTGTAEFGDPQGRTHAWYTSYAPEDDPKIALTVLVEAGGEGSSIAAPIAKDIYSWYFSTQKK